MATSSELEQRDVVNALQTLTDDESYKLFYHLEVPLHTLSTITSDYKGDIRKIRIMLRHGLIMMWMSVGIQLYLASNTLD